MKLFLILLTIHFVADFVLQTDWQAKNKSTNWEALSRHVGVYTLAFAPFAFYWFEPSVAWKFLTATFWLHFLTDAITSRINSRLWPLVREDGIWTQAEHTVPKHGRTLVNPFSFQGTPHWFFVGIGADQLSHAYALAWTVWLLS